MKTKVLKQEELKEKSGKQLDFRNNLKKSVKTKTVEQDDLKRKSAEQKDFRNQLKKAETKEPESKTVDETPVVKPEVSVPEPEVEAPEPEPVKEPVSEKPKSQEIVRNSENNSEKINSEEPEVPQTARTSTSSTNSSNQRQDRKRKPKITKFPEEIVECKQDESFEIVLEVRANQNREYQPMRIQFLNRYF